MNERNLKTPERANADGGSQSAQLWLPGWWQPVFSPIGELSLLEAVLEYKQVVSWMSAHDRLSESGSDPCDGDLCAYEVALERLGALEAEYSAHHHLDLVDLEGSFNDN